MLGVIRMNSYSCCLVNKAGLADEVKGYLNLILAQIWLNSILYFMRLQIRRTRCFFIIIKAAKKTTRR